MKKFRKKIITILVMAGAMAVPMVALGATPAEAGIREAGEHPWASRVEFGDVKGGWRLTRVNDHFDTRGRFESQSNGTMYRTYPGWAWNVEIGVLFVMRDGRWVVDHGSGSVSKWAYRI
jgi:hypothetical protein